MESPKFWRENRKIYNGLYASDLKLRSEYRSKEVVKNFLWYLFVRWPFKKDFQEWDFSYFCAMQRGGTGVEKTFKGSKKISWAEVYAGEKALEITKEWLPQETTDVISEYLVSI